MYQWGMHLCLILCLATASFQRCKMMPAGQFLRPAVQPPALHRLLAFSLWKIIDQIFVFMSMPS
jgi:hypothetical protein